MPVFIYLLLYVMTLLKIDNPDEIDSALDELFGEEEPEDETPLVIPPGSSLDMKVFSVPAAMRIGERCRLHGNIRANAVTVGEYTTIFGSLRAGGPVGIGRKAQIHGNVEGGGEVSVAPTAHILGDVAGLSLSLHEDALVEGMIRAPNGVRIERGGETE
jgi:predicted acyltransferase (DUF342 family)